MKKFVYLFVMFALSLISIGIQPQSAQAGNSVDVPAEINLGTWGPNQEMCFYVNARINYGALLESRGDMLRNTDGNLFGHWPHVAVVGSHYAGETYTFGCYSGSNSMKAPSSEGSYQSVWQVWQNATYVGQPVVLRFDVKNGANGSLPTPPPPSSPVPTPTPTPWPTPKPYQGNPTECLTTVTRSGQVSIKQQDGSLKDEHYVTMTIPYGTVLTDKVYSKYSHLSAYVDDVNLSTHIINFLFKRSFPDVERLEDWTVDSPNSFRVSFPPLLDRDWRILIPGRIVDSQFPVVGYFAGFGDYKDMWLYDTNKFVYLKCTYTISATSSDQYLPVLTNFAIVSPKSGTQLRYTAEIPSFMRYIQTDLRKGSNAKITLIAPDGTVYSPTDSAVTYVDMPHLAVHTLNLANPQGGTWQILVDVIQADADSVFMLNVYGKQYNDPSNDNIPPVTGMHFDGTKGNNGWFVSDATVSLSAVDNTNGTGLQGMEWSVDDGATWQTYSNPVVVSQEGFNYLLGRSRDQAGNNDPSPIGKFLQIDKTAPATQIELSGTLGNNGWYTTSVLASLTAADNVSGVSEVWHQVDGGAWVTNTVFTLNDGIHTVSYYSVDMAGNIEVAKSVIVKVDTIPPVVSVSTDKPQYTQIEPFVIHYTCVDPQPGSDVASCTATFNGQSVQNGQVMDLFWLDLGTYPVNSRGEDVAGWVTSNSASFELIATIESLQGTVTRLCAENWITNRGICNSLGQKLDAALAARNRGQSGVAINILQALQSEVNAQTNKAIKSEAARLLMMDSNYVIAHLR